MIKLFLMHKQNQKRALYLRLAKELFEPGLLPELPDCSFKVKWHWDSDFIPFLSRFAPRDAINIVYCSDLQMLRIDFNRPP